MKNSADLIILGASSRAAAFSAMRAGLRPWCADLFADTDLRNRCPVVRLEGGYPHGFTAVLETGPHVPWMYTGGLENHPRLVARLAGIRPLWGNDASILSAVRDPKFLADVAMSLGMPCPMVRAFSRERSASAPVGALAERLRLNKTRWLLKPLRSAGGTGIRFATPEESDLPSSRLYLQEFIEGEFRSALFVADGQATRLLGVTQQLVGDTWLRTAPFQYCGSIGPLAVAGSENAALLRLGTELVRRSGMRGLFGIDGVWREGAFWPVEINPRYTASVEVYEYATGLPALALHREAFDSTLPAVIHPDATERAVVGKAILFAREAIRFPVAGPWEESLRRLPPDHPDFADIPEPGQQIEARRPILSFFARAASVASCHEKLRSMAQRLEREMIASS